MTGNWGDKDGQTHNLVVDGIRYHLHKGPEINRDPSGEFPELWKKRTYGFCRRLCCRIFAAPPGCAISSFGTFMIRLVK